MNKLTATGLPDELNERLMLLAKRTGHTMSYCIREAVEDYIEDMEDIHLAEQVLERVRAGQERIYSANEVWNDLGLDD